MGKKPNKSSPPFSSDPNKPSSSSFSSDPGSLPTFYDETFHGYSANQVDRSIASMASLPTLIACLEHHISDTDGSFGICIAGGSGVFVSVPFFASIPQEHRPKLDTNDACTVSYALMSNTNSESLGSIILPFLLIDSETGQRFRMKLYAHVLTRLSIPVFIGRGGLQCLKEEIRNGPARTLKYFFEFPSGKKAVVEGFFPF
jgi:hypothetical protein